MLGDPLNSTYDDLLKKRGNNKREREREIDRKLDTLGMMILMIIMLQDRGRRGTDAEDDGE